MKKLFAISLMIVYFTFSVGIVIGYHFCGGKLEEVSLFKSPKNCCPDADTEKSCCHNSIAGFKITSDYSGDIATPDVPQVGFIALVQSGFSHSVQIVFGDQSDQMFDLHKLKHLSKQPVYLVNQVFIL
jgi:hypothetical protein